MFNAEQMNRTCVNHKNTSLAKYAITCYTCGIFQVSKSLSKAAPLKEAAATSGAVLVISASPVTIPDQDVVSDPPQAPGVTSAEPPHVTSPCSQLGFPQVCSHTRSGESGAAGSGAARAGLFPPGERRGEHPSAASGAPGRDGAGHPIASTAFHRIPSHPPPPTASHRIPSHPLPPTAFHRVPSHPQPPIASHRSRRFPSLPIPFHRLPPPRTASHRFPSHPIPSHPPPPARPSPAQPSPARGRSSGSARPRCRSCRRRSPLSGWLR